MFEKASRTLRAFGLSPLALLGVAIIFISIFALPRFDVRAAECTPRRVAGVTSSGGSLGNAPENAISVDGIGTLLGDGESPGWLVLDLGCFTDQIGADISIWKLDPEAGLLVLVGTGNADIPTSPDEGNGPRGAGWSGVEKFAHRALRPIYQCPAGATDISDCQEMEDPRGRVCQPELTIAREEEIDCQAGLSHYDLDIGNDDGARYRYVYLWSGGAEGMPAVVDAVLPSLQSAYFDVRGRLENGQYQGQLFEVPIGSTVLFQLTVGGVSPAETAMYQFSCNTDSIGQTTRGAFSRTSPTTLFAGGISCVYASPGFYTARAGAETTGATYQKFFQVRVVDAYTETSPKLAASAYGAGDSGSLYALFFIIVVTLSFIIIYKVTGPLHRYQSRRLHYGQRGAGDEFNKLS